MEYQEGGPEGPPFLLPVIQNTMLPIEQQLQTIIEPSLNNLGYEIVRIKLMDGEPKTLQIMAERQSDGELALEDCEAISRHLSALLDVEYPITDAYNLEVSSPGIDRPLTRRKDFTTYQGFLVKIQLVHPIEGRKRFTGIIEGIDEEDKITLRLNDGSGEAHIPFEALEKAKLVLTDELIAFSEEKQKQHAKTNKVEEIHGG